MNNLIPIIGGILTTLGILLGALLGFIMLSSLHNLKFHDKEPWFNHLGWISYCSFVFGVFLLLPNTFT